MVGEGDLGHFLQELQVLRSDPALQGSLNGFVAHIVDVVEVVGPAINAVRDEQVFVAVVVQVGEQRRPAPIGRGDAGQVSDLAEAAPAAIELQGVASVLGMVARLDPHVEHDKALGRGGSLEDLFLLRKHVEDH